MKAVIVEIKKTWVAALCADGRIIKIKNKHYMIGQEIDMKSDTNRLVKYAASAAAALVIFAVPAWAYLTPYSYVSIDVNPSVEFSLNRFDKVLSIKAANDDGEEILKEIDLNGLKNEDINAAVKEVINEIKQSGFLGEDGGVVVAASSKTEEKTEQLKEKVKTTVEDEVKGKGSEDSEKANLEENDENNADENNVENTENKKGKANSSVEVEAIGVGQERVIEAKNLGVTPGKLNLVEKLQASTDEKAYDTKEWLNKPVKDIMKEIKENKKAAEEKEKNKSNENINKKSDDSNAVNNNADTNSKNTKSKKK